MPVTSQLANSVRSLEKGEYKMTDVELAYAAGMFEGEGSIRINKPTRSNKGHLICTVANTDIQILLFYQERWPGCLAKKTGIGPNRKEAWVWTCASRKAEAFVKDIFPFLRTERVKTKALLGLEFQAQKQMFTRWNRAPEEYLNRQWEYFEEMKRLNKRGLI